MNAKRRATLGRALTAIAFVVAAAATHAATFDLKAAIAEAAPGATIHVPAGTYDGPLVIEKPIVLLAESGAVIDGHGRDTVVRIKAEGTVVRGFIVRGSGDDLDKEHCGIWVAAPHCTVENNVLDDVLFGICAHQAAGTIIRGNTIGGKELEQARRGDGIRLWYSADCVVEGNHVHDVRDVVVWFSRHVRLAGNDVTRSRYGMHFMYCDDNTLEDNRLEENSVGVYLMNSRSLVLRRNTFARNRGISGYGVGLKDMDGVVAEDNRVVGNRLGIYIDSSPNALDVYNEFRRNRIAYNDVGVALLPMVKRNRFHDNAFDDNQEQVAVLGNGSLEGNAFTVAGRGNFWSDYRGYDRDGDGLGDLPYRSQSFFENLMDRQPKLRLFVYSPAQQALEMTAQAFPAVKPRPKFEDTAPLMRAAPLNVPAQQIAGFGWPTTGTGVALVTAAGVVVALARTPSKPRAARRPAGAPSTADIAEFLAVGPVLTVRNLRKRFGRFVAVDDLSFELWRGEALALWGSNGAGKTTAIRCIMGLIHSRGDVSVAGRSLRRSGKALRGMIGYVPQESCFQGDLRVAEALRLYAKLKGVTDAATRCQTLLADVGLADHTDKRVAALSGGMRKRLALAAALLNDPPLLILDEIAANLDAEGRHAFLALLVRLKEAGKTILFTSHRLDEVETLADRVLVLRRGLLERDCRPAELTSVLGLRCDVKILLAEAQIESAVGLLAAEGYAARRNGRGVWVRVQADRKAGPIHLLARHRIVVENFEVEGSEGHGFVEEEESHV